MVRIAKRRITPKNKQVPQCYKQELWMRQLLGCQEEISVIDPHPHYADYKKNEIRFWVHIPKWIYENRSEKKVRCLDIGSAYGTLALYCKKILNSEVYCIDFVDTYLAKALVKKYDFKFAINNIELDSVPWSLDFDIIIFTETLEHLNFDPRPTLKKIHSLLSDDGKLFLSTPDATEWGRVTKVFNSINEMPLPKKGIPLPRDEKSLVGPHVYQYYKDELIDVLDQAGFKIDKFDYSPGGISRHFNFELSKK